MASHGSKNKHKSSSVLDSYVVSLCLLAKEEDFLNPGDKKHINSKVSCDLSKGDTNIKLPPCCCKVRSKSDCVIESINKVSKELVALQKEVNSNTKKQVSS